MIVTIAETLSDWMLAIVGAVATGCLWVFRSVMGLDRDVAVMQANAAGIAARLDRMQESLTKIHERLDDLFKK